jgi:hypothetical protein
VPGRGGRLDTAPAQEHRQTDAGEAKGRLCVLRQTKLVVVRCREKAAKIHACEGCAAVAQGRNLRVGEELDAHTRLL